MATSNATLPPKPERRWHQFSLQASLTAMLVSTVVLGGWLHVMRQRAGAHRERVAAVEEVVAAVEAMGGSVERDYKERRSATWLEVQFTDPGSATNPVSDLTIKNVDFRERDFRRSSMVYNLETLRMQIQFYKAQHDGLLPSADLSELIKGTNRDGTDGTEFGPYLQAIPVNGLTNKSDVKPITNTRAVIGDVTSGGGGWIYSTTSGNIWIDHADHYTE